MRSLSDVAAAEYSDSASPGGNFLPTGGPLVAVPDTLAPFHLASQGERRRRVRDVLAWAWRIYSRDRVTSMLKAVEVAADGSATGPYALVEIRKTLLEINLPAWESHPNRKRRDVHAAFRKTIGRLTPHRGGWTVRR